jgi:hypothetical protein
VYYLGLLAVVLLVGLAGWRWLTAFDWDADDRDPEQVDQHGEGR